MSRWQRGWAAAGPTLAERRRHTLCHDCASCDGTQVVTVGALRGLGETRLPFRISALSYWAVGMSLAATLAFGLGRGVIGLWYGFVVGLALACVLLVAVWVRHAREPLAHAELQSR